jgi:hypothetical protein
MSRGDDIFKNIDGRMLVYVESCAPRTCVGHFRYLEDRDSIELSLI